MPGEQQPALPTPTMSADVRQRDAGEPRDGEVRFNRAGRQEFYWRGLWRPWNS